MAEIIDSSKIAGVKCVTLRAFTAERGLFMETFRKEWFPERNWDIVQTNRNFSKTGVLRGLHYHHHQVDYWCVASGMLRVGLADLRPSSATFKASETIEIGDDNPVGIFIPVGVAHGFLSLTDSVLTYVVDNYYNGADELGVAWNDPALAINWGIANPLISERDRLNPRLAEIAPEKMPK
ncbi:MAG: dTDP-4-dehydrorhamnose 3,5-epimerase [Caldilineaceae bacterium]